MELSELGLDKDLSRAMARLGIDKELAWIVSSVDALDEQLDEVSVTEVSPDRLVRVTVGGRMEVRALELDPGIFEKPDAEALAATILDTIRRAATAADAQASALCEGIADGSADG